MELYIYDENNGLWYELHGDYYLPCLTVPEEEHQPSIHELCGVLHILGNFCQSIDSIQNLGFTLCTLTLRTQGQIVQGGSEVTGDINEKINGTCS